MISALPDLLFSGVSLFGQGARILKLRFSEQSNIPEDALLPHRIVGEESLSQLYRYTLDCLSVDTHLELKELLGQPVEVAILLPEGGQRLLTGLVTRAEQAGVDCGFAKYVLTIEPALATLAYRRNSRVFQDRTVPQIVETILNEHGTANPAFNKSFQHQAELSETYPIRFYCLQYRDTDLAFIQRLLAEEGISYRFTHGPDPKTSLKSSDDAGESGNTASNASGEEQGNNTDPPCTPSSSSMATTTSPRTVSPSSASTVPTASKPMTPLTNGTAVAKSTAARPNSPATTTKP